jgi:hypothetical protein
MKMTGQEIKKAQEDASLTPSEQAERLRGAKSKISAKKMPSEVGLLGFFAILNLIGGGIATLFFLVAASSAESADVEHYYVALGIGILAETMIVSTVLYAIAEILKAVFRIENRIEDAIGRAQSPVALAREITTGA